MAVGQAPAASILAPAASILAPARILQYFQYTGKRYQYTVLAPLEQPVQHTKIKPWFKAANSIATCPKKLKKNEYLIKNYIKSADKNIKLIYRGIDEKEYYQNYKPDQAWLNQWYEMYPDTRNTKLLTIAGRISPLKDFEKIISLAKSVKDNSPHRFKILIAGEAKDKHQKYLNTLKEKIKSLNLEGDVYFLNFRKDIKNIYSISSIVYNTSNKPESFGRSILEPLSIGIPCIGYNRGGVKEILETLFPYGLVEPDDKESLLNKTLAILDADNINIKENTEFLTSNMCKQTIDFYQEISS